MVSLKTSIGYLWFNFFQYPILIFRITSHHSPISSLFSKQKEFLGHSLNSRYSIMSLVLLVSSIWKNITTTDGGNIFITYYLYLYLLPISPVRNSIGIQLGYWLELKS